MRGLVQLHIFVAGGAGVPVVGIVMLPLGAGSVLVLGLVVGVFVAALADAVLAKAVRGLVQLHIFVAGGAGVPVVGVVMLPLGAGSVLVLRSRGRGAGADVQVLVGTRVGGLGRFKRFFNAAGVFCRLACNILIALGGRDLHDGFAYLAAFVVQGHAFGVDRIFLVVRHKILEPCQPLDAVAGDLDITFRLAHLNTAVRDGAGRIGQGHIAAVVKAGVAHKRLTAVGRHGNILCTGIYKKSVCDLVAVTQSSTIAAIGDLDITRAANSRKADHGSTAATSLNGNVICIVDVHACVDGNIIFAVKRNAVSALIRVVLIIASHLDPRTVREGQGAIERIGITGIGIVVVKSVINALRLIVVFPRNALVLVANQAVGLPCFAVAECQGACFRGGVRLGADVEVLAGIVLGVLHTVQLMERGALHHNIIAGSIRAGVIYLTNDAVVRVLHGQTLGSDRCALGQVTAVAVPDHHIAAAGDVYRSAHFKGADVAGIGDSQIPPYTADPHVTICIGYRYIAARHRVDIHFSGVFRCKIATNLAVDLHITDVFHCHTL